jgi:hypothetical protein
MPKYKRVLRVISGILIFYGIGSSLGVTAAPQNIMQQIYLGVNAISCYSLACALLLF